MHFETPKAQRSSPRFSAKDRAGQTPPDHCGAISYDEFTKSLRNQG
jgi:hypothetical protein